MIYLVRHGESTWNVAGRVQGQVPHPPLTPRGRAQVLAAAGVLTAAGVLAGAAVRTVVTSGLVRAAESAALLAAALEVPVRTDERLREQSLGRLEGLSSDAALDALGRVDWTDPDARPGGGESAQEVSQRMAAAILSAFGTGAVLVSHADAIRAALGWWRGDPVPAPWTDVGPAAVFALGPVGVVRELRR